MKILEEIKKLRRNAKEIRDLFLVRIPSWAEYPKTYDKTGWGFNGDDRFKSCSNVQVFFYSLMGTYGNSSCTTQCSLDADVFASHLIKYLNKNQKAIMLAIADQIEDEARSIKEKAENELNQELNSLKELETK